MNDKVGYVSYDVRKREVFASGNKLYSSKMAELIDSEVQVLISSALERTKKLLRDHKDNVIKV